MSLTNTKTELHKLIDSMPEQIAEALLEQVKSVLNKDSSVPNTSELLAKIFKEDDEVLTKLAK